MCDVLIFIKKWQRSKNLANFPTFLIFDGEQCHRQANGHDNRLMGGRAYRTEIVA